MAYITGIERQKPRKVTSVFPPTTVAPTTVAPTTVAPTAATSSGGSGSAPGGGVTTGQRAKELLNAVLGSSMWGQYEDQTRAYKDSIEGKLGENIQSLFGGFGYIPDSYVDKKGFLDPNIRAFAAQSTKAGLSPYARILEAHALARRAIPRRLAAKGLRRSGARGYALRQAQTDHDRNIYDSINSLLGQSSKLYGGYTDALYKTDVTDRLDALTKALGVFGALVPPSYKTPSGGAAGGGAAGGGAAGAAKPTYQPSSGFYTIPSGRGGRLILD